jgi:hypothetical protein
MARLTDFHRQHACYSIRYLRSATSTLIHYHAAKYLILPWLAVVFFQERKVMAIVFLD